MTAACARFALPHSRLGLTGAMQASSVTYSSGRPTLRAAKFTPVGTHLRNPGLKFTDHRSLQISPLEISYLSMHVSRPADVSRLTAFPQFLHQLLCINFATGRQNRNVGRLRAFSCGHFL